MQEKPLSIALREINDDLLTCEDIDPEAEAARPSEARAAAADRRGTVVLGVSGGIAAYKACELLRRLTESGHDVTVVPDRRGAAVRRRAPTWSALSGKPVHDRRVDRRRTRCRTSGSASRPTSSSSHRPPPTCSRKAAHGLADDLLTNTLLTARCPVVIAPAMHTEMWEHPATQANVATLSDARRPVVIEPAPRAA